MRLKKDRRGINSKLDQNKSLLSLDDLVGLEVAGLEDPLVASFGFLDVHAEETIPYRPKLLHPNLANGPTVSLVSRDECTKVGTDVSMSNSFNSPPLIQNYHNENNHSIAYVSCFLILACVFFKA